MAIIVAAFAVLLLSVRIDSGGVLSGQPDRSGGGLLLIVGIVGATVMPHVVYLHSALVTDRIHRPTGAAGGRFCAGWASTCPGDGRCGAANLAMLVFAAAGLHGVAEAPVETLDQAHATIGLTIGASRPRPSRSGCSPRACRARASGRSPAR